MCVCVCLHLCKAAFEERQRAQASSWFLLSLTGSVAVSPPPPSFPLHEKSPMRKHLLPRTYTLDRAITTLSLSYKLATHWLCQPPQHEPTPCDTRWCYGLCGPFPCKYVQYIWICISLFIYIRDFVPQKLSLWNVDNIMIWWQRLLYRFFLSVLQCFCVLVNSHSGPLSSDASM